MPISQGQRQNAKLIYSLARGQGLTHQQALEMVAAAYAESGLSTNATNKSSGAAGLFQLLSSGYRDTATRLGGLYDPSANTRAILPSYALYFREHPNAQPGEAGRDVERSGAGAGFYAGPLGIVKGLVNADGSTGVKLGEGENAPSIASSLPPTTPSRQFALNLIQSIGERMNSGPGAFQRSFG